MGIVIIRGGGGVLVPVSALGIVIVFCWLMAEAKSTAVLFRVDQYGKGGFKKIQDAIDAVPHNNNRVVFIWVKPGVYREKIIVPADKPFITLSGTLASNTIITWNEGGNILESATVTVLASDFVCRYLTVQNTYGSEDKAVALRVKAERASFYDCRILSYQDTLFDESGKHYYKNCYIEGATDFICGNGASLFQGCHLHSVSKVGGAITAQKRTWRWQKTGFTFFGCKITGSGSAVLGRPWGAYSRVVFILTYMSKVVLPQGWDDWEDQNKHRSVYYGEYNCYGAGANRGRRVKWSRSLSKYEAQAFINSRLMLAQIKTSLT
ncbi:putative pectinesterase 11 [Impatiens glandulifera]|uniref:putative pectinesterase 11 n=1 Tax=Impatiens glandulifera TaxID=253017 RepID=UPI001FB07E50|nr:putative pectinesterase 11 [Impatiens glandulifera]